MICQMTQMTMMQSQWKLNRTTSPHFAEPWTTWCHWSLETSTCPHVDKESAGRTVCVEGLSRFSRHSRQSFFKASLQSGYHVVCGLCDYALFLPFLRLPFLFYNPMPLTAWVKMAECSFGRGMHRSGGGS